MNSSDVRNLDNVGLCPIFRDSVSLKHAYLFRGIGREGRFVCTSTSLTLLLVLGMCSLLLL